MSAPTRAALGLAFVALAAGCATAPFSTPIAVSVNALASPNAADHKTFVLVPDMQGVAADDLQYQQFAGYVRRALEMRGLVPASDAAGADMKVALSYSISGPEEHTVTYSTMERVKTGATVAQTVGTINGYGDNAQMNATTTTTPEYRLVPQEHTRTETAYTRRAGFVAFDSAALRDSGRVVQLWSTTVTSTGSGSDLRAVFPAMLAAAAPWLGADSKKQLNVMIHTGDARVLAITQGPEGIVARAAAP